MGKKLLTKIKNYHNSNGLVGYSSSQIKKFYPSISRGGSLHLPGGFLKEKTPREKAEAQITGILEDTNIAEGQKDPYRDVYDVEFQEDSYSSFEEHQRQWLNKNQNFDNDPKFEKLKKSLILKSKHPFYSHLKTKLPSGLFLCVTNMELKKLAVYRTLGYASAPFTGVSWVAISLPCAVTFSMLEMYSPDKFKLPCKVMKWSGGCLYYGVCALIDAVSEPIEKKVFGDSLPIDAPQTLGTLPQRTDFEEIYEWSKQFQEKTF